jgi:dienelactone hydrolase
MRWTDGLQCRAARYDKPAADLAWSRTVAFFKEHLGAPPRAT